MPLIICFFVGMSLLSYRFIAGRQTYTAAAVIEYTNANARYGYAPDGTQINLSEIGSSANVLKAMESLDSYYGSYSLDQLCAGITTEAIVDEQFRNIQEAVNDEGEEYTARPTAYIVRCTLDSSGSEEMARDILNQLLDVYFSDYSQKHVNQGQVNNEINNLLSTDYDYLEMAERLERQLSDTIKTLDTRYLDNYDFRSTASGYSFADLRDQFVLIKDVDISRLYSMILGGQITKDRQLLLNKYENRIANHNLTSQKSQENIADILEVIDAYVDKMRISGNTDIDYNYILNDVYDEEWTNGSRPNRTVQYDALLRSWVEKSNTWDYAEIDAAYCSYIIGIYRDGETALNDPAEPEEEEPVVSVPYAATHFTSQQVEREIAGIIERMNALYDTVAVTNEEYNEYLGAKNIRTLSGVSASPGINLNVYMIFIGLFFILIGCCGAILLGRMGDVLEYLFLTDDSTGCRNRVSCDKYIQKHEKIVLPLSSCCVSLQIVNQKELNDAYGRAETDRVFKEFGRILRDLFESSRKGFVGYNGGGQFLAFFEMESENGLSQEVFRLEAALKQAFPQLPVAYQLGAANAGELAMFQLRALISSAVRERRLCVTGEVLEVKEAPEENEENKEGAMASYGDHRPKA